VGLCLWPTAATLLVGLQLAFACCQFARPGRRVRAHWRLVSALLRGRPPANDGLGGTERDREEEEALNEHNNC